MAEQFNPYAPPAAELDAPHEAGGVWRDGKQVLMERNATLPGRCVACNSPALPKRVDRTLYWTPWQWRVAAWSTPPVLIALAFTGVETAGVLVLPAIVILAIVNAILRKRIQVEVGLCARHTRIRIALGWAGLGCVALVPCVILGVEFIGLGNLGAVIGSVSTLLILVGFAYSFTTSQRVAVSRLTTQHAWLKGTDRAFRDSLPERPQEPPRA
jgi:hypothetical protein